MTNRDCLNQLPDAMLISRFIKNENEAFDVIVLRHRQHIYSYLFKMSCYKDKEQAEDLTQDVFIRAMQSIRKGTYNESSQFISWLMCIARNICIDCERKKSRQRILETTYKKDLFGNLDNLFETHQEKRLMDKETQKELAIFLNQLDDNQRETLVFHFFGGYKYKDIVKILNDGKTSINTYLGRSRYGLKNLKDMLDKSKFLRA
jgi:RNA polymerase sigma factor (sigma-70 family)